MKPRHCACGARLNRSAGMDRCARCRMESGPLEQQRATARRAEERDTFNQHTKTWAPATLRRERAARKRRKKKAARGGISYDLV